MYNAIGVIGFEPTASASQRRRSTKLSYTPFTMHLSVCYVGATPNILTVYTGVGSSTTANIQRGLIPAELAPLVGTSQVLAEPIITLLVSSVKWFPVFPSMFMNQIHSNNWNNNQYKTQTSYSKWIVKCGSSDMCCLVCYAG